MQPGKTSITQNLPFYLVPKSLFTTKHPSWRAILAYSALAYYANNGSRSCEAITLRTLARLVDTSKTTIQRGLAELESKGAIKAHRRSKKSPAGKRIPLASLYELVNLDEAAGEPI